MCNFDIQPISSPEDWQRANSIRKEVFAVEMGIAGPDFGVYNPQQNRAIHLTAKVAQSGRTIAVLSVIDTTGNEDLLSRYRLRFALSATSARYTGLAVLKPYRGLNIPLMLMVCAQREFIEPMSFDFSWLLFNPKLAPSSSICRLLGFSIASSGVPSEYGEMCTLVRDERRRPAWLAANPSRLLDPELALSHGAIAPRPNGDRTRPARLE